MRGWIRPEGLVEAEEEEREPGHDEELGGGEADEGGGDEVRREHVERGGGEAVAVAEKVAAGEVHGDAADEGAEIEEGGGCKAERKEQGEDAAEVERKRGVEGEVRVAEAEVSGGRPAGGEAAGEPGVAEIEPGGEVEGEVLAGVAEEGAGDDGDKGEQGEGCEMAGISHGGVCSGPLLENEGYGFDVWVQVVESMIDVLLDSRRNDLRRNE